MNNDTTVKYWVVYVIDNCGASLIQQAVDTATMGYNGHHGNSVFFLFVFFLTLDRWLLLFCIEGVKR